MTARWPYARLVAHRGGGALAPENTLAAFRIGARLGFTMAEFDAKLSADDVAFLLHDDTVDRTSSGHGAASELPYAAIAELDAGSWFHTGFAGEHMPTLAGVAGLVTQLGVDVNIEIKPSSGRETITGERVALEAKRLWHGATAPVLSSFSEEALRAAQRAVPELPRGMLFHQVPADWEARCRVLACLSIHVNHKVLDAALVRAMKAAGLFIMAYTVNDLDRARTLVDWGVDSICTDRIDRINAETLR